MKKIFGLVFLLISFKAFSQGPTGYQYRKVNERIQGKFMVDSLFTNARYADTTAANLHLGVDSCGSQIFTYDDNSIWVRGCNPKTWIKLAKYSELILRLNISDTSAMLTPYLRGATAGYGMLITGSQHKTWTVDSFSLATRARVQKGIDSLGALISSASGIDDVLAVGQALTTNRTIDVGSSDLIVSQGSVFTATFGSSGAGLRSTSETNAGLWGISNDDVAGVVAENSSITAASLQSSKNISNTHLSTPGIDIHRLTTGTAESGIGSKIRFITETSTGVQDTTNKIESFWSTVTHASRESQLNIHGVDNTAQEIFMNIQKDLVRINNNADTLATLQDVRDGGGGGISAADLPLRITGSTVSADTSVAYSPSLTTNERTQKILDSLQAAGWGNQSVNSDYRYYVDMTGSTFANAFFGGTGVGSGTLIPTTPIADGWMYGRQLATGTTTTGRAWSIPASGAYTPIAISTSYRYSAGAKIRLEDLSDGTETFGVMFGFMDDVNNYASIVDGFGFRYTNADSSGTFIAWTKSNSTTTEDATDITVAADTDYFLQVTAIGGSVYYYINGVLKATISTNIPTGTTRWTSLGLSIFKSAGTTSRLMYVNTFGYDWRDN